VSFNAFKKESTKKKPLSCDEAGFLLSRKSKESQEFNIIPKGGKK